MLRETKAFVRKLGMIIATDHYLPFLILGVIGAAFVIAFIFEAGPAVVFAVLAMGCIAAVMESIAGRNNTNSRWSEPMGPVAQADGHDAPGLIDEFVPSGTAVVEKVFVACEDAVWQPVVAQELSDVFNRIELGTFWWQRDESDVLWHDELGREVPSGLIEQEYGVPTGRDLARDFGKMQVHRLSIAEGEDESCALALAWAGQSMSWTPPEPIGSLMESPLRSVTRSALPPRRFSFATW
jgi:hypothetical protein